MKYKFEIAAFAGGSFYIMETIFSQVLGVYSVVSGYSGGHLINPTYREVCSGKTGHAETVKIEFNPEEISYQSLLQIFMNAHNPMTLNKQGSNIGSQYRSLIFCTTEQQLVIAQNYLEVLAETNVYTDRIVTEICKLEQFFEAESYHQKYYLAHHQQPYSKFVIENKLFHLKRKFGNLMGYQQLVS